ncbi:acyltransferase family protein [Salegentibacter sp. HM20]
MIKKKDRLDSIDVLRGFDMLMIIVADKFFYHLDVAAGIRFTGFLATQFSHPDWYGFHFYDIIMPLFLFLVGVVIPFSIDSRLKTGQLSRRLLNLHVLRRFLILFVLGWIVQGNLLEFDLNSFKIFSNTLQAIAVGYVFSTLTYIHLSRISRYVFFAVCLIIYVLLLEFIPVHGHAMGVVEPEINLAIYVDRLIFGKFDDGLQYTWVLSSLGFVATTLSGLFAGEFIKENAHLEKRLKNLILYGGLLLIMGIFLNAIHPFIKKIWTSTFVLITSGICTLMLALFFWVIDIKKQKSWILPFKIIGSNAIVAYVLSHVINFSGIADQLLFGLKQFFKEYYESITVLGGFAILYLLLWYLYKNNSLIKI